MSHKNWTKDEIALLRSDLTNEQIVKKTGRTFYSVINKRKKVIGRCDVKPVEVQYPLEKESDKWTDEEKETRITTLAWRLGVRLKR